jgi:hypothetical protein
MSLLRHCHRHPFRLSLPRTGASKAGLPLGNESRKMFIALVKDVGTLEGALSHPFRFSFIQVAELPSLQQPRSEKSSPSPSLPPGDVVPLM